MDWLTFINGLWTGFWPVIKLLLPYLVLILGVKWGFNLWHENRLRRSGMNEIDNMSGEEFEKCLSVLFKDMGYKTQLTRRTGDFGADIILAKDGRKTAVQAKRYAKPVGVKAVQEVVGSLARYQCEKGMVITNSIFTNAARELAKANKIELWDRDRLVNELLNRQV